MGQVVGQVVAKLLTEMRLARIRGLPFEEAWPDAMSAALLELRWQSERSEWSEVLEGTRDVWRSAYERLDQSEKERALGRLGQ